MFFSVFLPTCTKNRILNLSHMIMRRMYYHCSIRAQPTSLFLLCFYACTSTRIINFNHMIMRRMYYHCSIRAQPTSTHCFSLYMHQEQDSKPHSHDNEARVLPLWQGTTELNKFIFLLFFD